MSSYKNTRSTRSTRSTRGARSNFIVLDYDGNEVFDQSQPNTEPVTPTRRYNLRSRTRTASTNTPSTPQKPTHTRSMSSDNVTSSIPLIFQAPKENVVVNAVAIDSAFNDTIVYEADDGSIVLRGFTQGLSYFIDRGATEDISDTEDEDEDEDEYNEHDLSEFTYEEYGRGYLLYPPIDHAAIGQKYFFDAWWMPKFDAWFFKSEFLDEFISMGASEIENESEEDIEEESEEEIEEESEEESDEESEEEEDNLAGFCYVKHGRGYLLYSPNVYHEWNGQKYFFNAWWMPKFDAWFFKSEFLDEFIEMGVVEGEYSDDEESSCDDDESDEETEDTEDTEDAELDGYSYKAYGRGFLLYSPTTDNHGTKYFHDAWWMPKQNAWFFRRQHLDNFLDMGVTQA